MKKISTAVLVSAAVAASMNSHAYQVELGLQRADESGELRSVSSWSDSETDIDSVTTRLSADIYFQPVDTSKGPLAEAAFLDKASSVSFVINKEDVDQSRLGDESNNTTDTRALSVRGVISEKFIIEALYAREEYTYDYGYWGEVSDETNFRRLGFGTYLSDSSSLIVSYEQWPESSYKKYVSEVSYHHLLNLSDASALALSADVALIKEREDYGFDDYFYSKSKSISLGATYYFSQELGLGGKVTLDADPSFYVFSQELTLDYFAAPNIRLSGAILLQDAQAEYLSEGESTGVRFGIATRF